ncbi:MAG: hypothetical protein QHC88_06165 [Achromobacter sp.]|uniref:hypothetical protein n=1 Tax=Achromobacter sp. TaxID=134375 RepID=UPI0029AF656E|nr:hypothetical protein [Achromobacter sp.]MDX3984823.1 hypothetical protein [Achromobacter sp.]
MTARAIDPTGQVRIADIQRPYVQDRYIHDPYRSERLRAPTRAAPSTQLRPSSYARIQAAQGSVAMAAGAPLAPAAHRPAGVDGAQPPASVDAMRDQYTAHCLKNAIQAYHDQQARLDARSVAANRQLRDEQTALQARADAAHDLGTIQGLLPYQAYRFAAGVMAVLPPPFTVAAGMPLLMVGPVGTAAKPRHSTDDASGGAAPYPSS